MIDPRLPPINSKTCVHPQVCEGSDAEQKVPDEDVISWERFSK